MSWGWCRTPSGGSRDQPNAFKELREDANTKTKAVSLNSSLDVTSDKTITHGYWFSIGSQMVCCRMATMEELHDNHKAWWRTL